MTSIHDETPAFEGDFGADEDSPTQYHVHVAEPEPKRFLDRAAIFALPPDIEVRDVYVEEWGGHVRIRALTAAERDRWEESVVTIKGKDRVFNMRNIRARLVALTAIDVDTGQRLFSNDDAHDLGKRSAKVLDMLFEAAQELSGISEKDTEELAAKPESQDGDSDDA